MKQFKIDISFIITSLLIFFSPFQDILLPFLICMIIHELGHVCCSYIFKIKINYLRITAVGMYLAIDTYKLSLLKEIILYSGGIIFNLISLTFLPYEYKNITLFIILFNILPIYPLDGFRLLKSILNSILSYRLSTIITTYLSLFAAILGFIYMINKLDYLLAFNIIYLAILSIVEIKNIRYSYESFILYKYLNKPNLKRKRIRFNQNLINKLYRFHTIYTEVGNKIVTEDDILNLHYKSF